MKFTELDRRMRVYETSADLCVLPGLNMVARLDGRSFTRLTKDVCAFERPFDAKFRDLMIETATALLDCGFRVRYAYTESDEISLLLDRDEVLFGRKLRKYDSLLAGTASAEFSVRLGRPATFDCRISQLPSTQAVVDYFRWRQADAGRNALNSYAYWTLRNAGLTARAADRQLRNRTVDDKWALLRSHGVDFAAVPAWQTRGIGLRRKDVELTAVDPRTNTQVTALRRRLDVDLDLPQGSDYDRYLLDLMEA